MFPSLFAHLAWADLRTLNALRSMREAPPQAIDLFAHMLAAEHVWLRRIEQGTPAYEIWPKLSLDECERLARANHAAFTAIAGSDATRLADIVDYTNSTGRAFSTPLNEILLHVTHHGMYHRGQVALLVRASGGLPQSTDYIAFVRA